MDGQLMHTFITILVALCSLSFSLLAVAAFALGMDTGIISMLGFMSLVSTGHAIAIAKF
jgi:hypothetical protein